MPAKPVVNASAVSPKRTTRGSAENSSSGTFARCSTGESMEAASGTSSISEKTATNPVNATKNHATGLNKRGNHPMKIVHNPTINQIAGSKARCATTTSPKKAQLPVEATTDKPVPIPVPTAITRAANNIYTTCDPNHDIRLTGVANTKSARPRTSSLRATDTAETVKA